VLCASASFSSDLPAFYEEEFRRFSDQLETQIDLMRDCETEMDQVERGLAVDTPVACPRLQSETDTLISREFERVMPVFSAFREKLQSMLDGEVDAARFSAAMAQHKRAAELSERYDIRLNQLVAQTARVREMERGFEREVREMLRTIRPSGRLNEENQ
jgi:hypothetical protein